MHRVVRRISASVAGALFVGVVSLVGAPAALAHVDVDTYSPSTGEVIQSTPELIELEMSADPGNINVRLYHRDGREVPLTGGAATIDGVRVTVQPPALDVGTYVVTWDSVGPDGHVTAGQSHFSVGAADGSPTDLTSDVNRSVSPVVKIAQWIAYLALAVAFGAAWLGIVKLTASARRRQLLAYGAAAGFAVAELTRLVLVAIQFSPDSPWDGFVAIVTRQPNGAGWGLLAVGAVLMGTARPWLGLLGVTAAAFGDILTGHLASTPNWPLLVGLASLHLLAVSVWVGPLLAHLFAGYRGRAANLTFATRFTWWALGAVGVIAVSGLVLAYLRMGSLDLATLFSREYGLTILYKIGIIAAVAAPLGLYHSARVLMVKAREYERRISEESTSADEPAAGAPETATPESPAAPASVSGLAGITILLEVVALVAVTFLGASLSSMPPNVTTVVTAAGEQTQDLLAIPQSFEECTNGPDQVNQVICIEKFLTNMAETQGMPKALAEITTRWQAGDEWMQKYCHVIGHKIGRLGYRMFQDIPTAFKQGSDPCDYGYLHGVIEGASSDFSDEKLREEMVTMCDSVGDLRNHTYRQCIHGLGHAAARRVNNDLPRAMDFCNVFYVEGSDVARSGDEPALRFNSCVTGVAMEWNTQSKALDAMKLPIGHPETLMGQCLSVDERFHAACIEYGTSSMGGILEREIAAREWCDKNLKDPLPCYWSIGRDVIWSPTISPEQAIEVCTGGKQGIYAEECIKRALGSVATIKLDASAIDDWCVNVPGKYKFLCPIVRDKMKTQIEQTVRGYIIEEDGTSPPSGEPGL